MVEKGIEPEMHPYGACYHDLSEQQGTGVIEWLKENKVTDVIVGGLATDYCVKTTVLQLVKAGFKVILNKAACRGIADDSIQSAYQEMQDIGVIFIASSQELAR
ncbi:isochorismatase family protein [Psychromonas sp. KJ10-2]|uniref:isochorismatase family protein n=1 Tax=Psychromonas sp. KJ10-2 TaxID=3391822 RepID=UPI0039B6E192